MAESGESSTPSFETLFRKFMETFTSNAMPSVSGVAPNALIDAIPEFGGADLGEDAKKWCQTVERITEKLPLPQRLSLATHALTGPAKKWYQSWEGNPRSWEKFSEDLCSVFVSEDRLCERLARAVAYTSDAAESYSEYARNKLKYFGQTQIEFKQHELISLVIGHITDASVRQSLLNARYTSTVELLSGVSQFVKVKSNKEPIREMHEEKGRVPFKKQCYNCGEWGHTANYCSKRSRMGRKRSPPRSITCSYCLKQGHSEDNCWAKRARRDESEHKKPNLNMGQLQTNVCFSVDHKLTPILLRDTLVRESLIDSGATCSLVKETVAKRANCKIDPFATTIKGLSDSSTTTIGSTTAIIRSEGLSVELDLFVVPDSSIPYGLIVGKNVLSNGGVRIVTETDGSTTLQRTSSGREKGTSNEDPVCFNIENVSDETRRELSNLLDRYKHMVAVGSQVRRVSTGDMKIVTKEDRVESLADHKRCPRIVLECGKENGMIRS
ncbi:uncharacterized protein LOC143266223 [Megachile rotundata]|uniref:uncharacterized protein LOC143266223 n=1 Tax=Megachile rotundata TaxID=143995 RepID=UPI003FD55FBE